MTHRSVLGRVATIIGIIGLIGGCYYFLKINTVKPISGSWPTMSWRVQIFVKKAFGGIPELSWTELSKMTAHEGGFSLYSVTNGESVSAALTNPYNSRYDLEAGRILFRQQCTGCHGADGEGSLGPSLARSGYKNGDSDLGIYRTLTDGLAGTSMEPAHLSFAERWQVVQYLRTLQLHSDYGEEGAPAPSLNIQAAIGQISKAESFERMAVVLGFYEGMALLIIV